MTEVKKAESHSRLAIPKREVGQGGMVTASRFITDTKKTELLMPTRFGTFDRMCEDDAVMNSIDITNLHTVAALHGGSFVSKTAKGKIAADFLNYNIRNMSQGTWLDACLNAVTDLKYGFSLLNIVTEVRKYGKYKGNRVLKKLSPRSQTSVYGWVWDTNQRELLGLVQKPMRRQRKVSGFKDALNLVHAQELVSKDYTYLESDQLLHFKHNSTNNNPQGDSPLMHCFDAWMEKKLVENYEVVGVSKDMGGMVVLRVPSELIEQANDPETYPDAQEEYKQIQLDAANLHAGKTTNMVLLSDRDEQGNPHYDIDLKGIDGGGKQYNTSDIIDQKRKSIYNVFGTGFLLLGQGNTGSNNAAETGNTTHDYYVNRAVLHKLDVLNNQLAPRLLAANRIYLDYEDMPTFVPADPSEASIDDIGKFLQRVGSIGLLTQEVMEYFMNALGAPTDGLDKLDYQAAIGTKAGTSQGTSGTGSTQSGGSKSDTNSNNSASKTLINDNGTIIDVATGDPISD